MFLIENKPNIAVFNGFAGYDFKTYKNRFLSNL